MKFRYDNKVNPLPGSGIHTVNVFSYNLTPDIMQVNNPVYSYFENSVMSSFPPEYDIEYEYNSEGLPVSAEMKSVRYPDMEPITVVYEYGDKE